MIVICDSKVGRGVVYFSTADIDFAIEIVCTDYSG